MVAARISHMLLESSKTIIFMRTAASFAKISSSSPPDPKAIIAALEKNATSREIFLFSRTCNLEISMITL